MSLTYVFKTGKYKGKQIKWVQKHDYPYLRDVNKGKIKIKLTQTIKDFLHKLCDSKITTTSQVSNDVIKMYKEGYKRSDIITVLEERGYTSDYAATLIMNANTQIVQEFEENKDYLIGLHLRRYDSTHDKHISAAAGLIGFKHKYKRIEHYILAMDALIAKERLLGLHTKKYNIQLNNFVNRDKVEADGEGYNFDKLTTKELIELIELMTATKLVKDDGPEIELFNDALIQTAELVQDVVEETEDIDHEEIEESPLAKVSHNDVFGNKIREQRRKSGNTIDTVEKKIRDSNRTAFEIIMEKQKNSKK